MYAKQTKPRIRTATYVTVVGRHTTRTGTPVRVGEASAVEQPATHYARTVVDLVNAARAGDQGSWNDLVDRFLPLVTSVIARYRLQQSDADDVNQTVWLRLVEHLDDLREPRALPGWLATTARNESLQVIRRRGRDTPVDPQAATMARADDLPRARRERDPRRASQRPSRGDARAATPAPRAARVADGRPPDLLRPDQRHAGHPQRKHRSDPGTRPGAAAPHPGHPHPCHHRLIDLNPERAKWTRAGQPRPGAGPQEVRVRRIRPISRAFSFVITQTRWGTVSR